MNNAYYIFKDREVFWKVDKDFICYYYSMGIWMEAMNQSPNFYSEIFMDAVAKDQLTRITKQEFENSLMLKELKK